jgi:MOSC domain-containing protein YiiM
MAHVASVNLGRQQPNPYKRDPIATGITKRPQVGPVEVRAPGPKHGGLGSGLVGDYIGDGRHHGGDGQAVYAFSREDLDRWERRLDRSIPNGFFGENLTTVGLDLAQARIGERWRVGADVVLQVTSPRIPCATFRGQMAERGWLKTFTRDGRPGAYLSVVTPGRLAAGDELEVLHRPEHDVTVAVMFRAFTTERDLLPALLAAGEDLDPETRDEVAAYEATSTK